MTATTPVDAVHVDASIIVCTYNRAHSLVHTLDALERQHIPEGLRWEVIVVDNNSSDDTRAAVEGFQLRSPHIPLRYTFERAQGLSHARNHGLAAARGAILLFTDDDVRPEPDWLTQVVGGMNEHDCDACGGWIGPIWERHPPGWLTERFYGFLAIRPDSLGPYQVTAASDPPFGANMAFRRSVFERIGGFDVRRGRVGNNLAGSEEWDLFQRLLADGGKVMYLPAARVHHVVEAFRVEKRYFRRWRFEDSRRAGRSEDIPAGRRVLGVPPYLIAHLLRSVWRTLVSHLTRPADEAFRQEMIIWHFLGLIAGLRERPLQQAPGAIHTS